MMRIKPFISHSKMKRCLNAALFALISLILSQASAYNVRGIVADNTGEPEAYATVRIYPAADTSKVSSMGITKDNGQFNLSLDRTGKYLLKVVSIGRQPLQKEFVVTSSTTSVDLGTLTVSNDDKMLGEITVTAVRPVVTKEIDRIGYDVQADDESKTSTLEEMLRKVPLVSVDTDGTITVKGSSDFKIYKNGRPNNSFTKNAKDIFKAIPASMIKKIEVITDPGAREDAEGVGAILNIVTLENTITKGFMGNASLSYNTRNNFPTPNFWGSAQIDKVTLSLYAGVNPFPRRSNKYTSEQRNHYNDSGNDLLSTSRGSYSGIGTWFGVDASYELDSLNLFTAEFGGYAHNINQDYYGLTQMTSQTGDLIYKYNSTQLTSPSKYFDINGGFNYQRSTKRPGERFTLSYQIATTDQTQNTDRRYYETFNMPVNYTGTISEFKLNFIEHTFQFDWSRMYAKIHTLDLGLKYINRNNHSITHENYIDFLDMPKINFKHTTHVAAAYADYRVQLKKFSLRGGLRYEFSRLEARYANEDADHSDFASNMSDLVPNAAVSYNINDSNTLKLSYSTRINRPGISYLNPQVSETPTTVSKGNPDLGSARNSSITLNYSLIGQKFNIDFSAGYTFTNNDIIEVQYLKDDRIYSDYANAGRNKSFNSGAFIQWIAGKKTTLMFNLNGGYDHYRNPSLNINHGGWSGRIYTRLSQKLPWDIQGSASLFYHTGSVMGLYSDYRPIGISSLNYGISLQRSFLKEKRLTISLSTWNPIFSSRRCSKVEYFNLPYTSINKTWNQSSKSFQISVAYRFGSMNTQVKKTVKSISNDDLTGGKLGGESSSSSQQQ